MTLNVVFDILPSLKAFLETFTMPAFDEIKAAIQQVGDALAATKADILAKIETEKTQVADAIAALEAKLGDMVTPDQLAALKGDFEALKTANTGTDVADAVAAIYEPPTPPAA